MLTCTGVSFAHGSNDGQKGMGLIMLILVGIVPLSFAVDLNTNQAQIMELAATTETIFVPNGPACSWRRDGWLSNGGGRSFRVSKNERRGDGS